MFHFLNFSVHSSEGERVGCLRVPTRQSGSQLREVDQDHSRLTWPTVGGEDTGLRVPCVSLSLLSGSWDEEKLENVTTTKVLASFLCRLSLGQQSVVSEPECLE